MQPEKAEHEVYRTTRKEEKPTYLHLPVAGITRLHKKLRYDSEVAGLTTLRESQNASRGLTQQGTQNRMVK